MNLKQLEQFIDKYPNKDWNWAYFSRCVKIPLSFFHKYDDKPFDWFHLALREDITIEFVRKHLKMFEDHFEALSTNRAFTYECICENSDLPWIWENVCANPNVTMNIIFKNPEMLHWKGISMNPTLSMSMVCYYHNKIDFNQFTYRKDLTLDVIRRFPNKNWNWDFLSHRNSLINACFVCEFINKPWNFKAISQNSDIDLSLFDRFPDKDWEWHFIAGRHDITPEFIERHIDKFPFCSLSANFFKKFEEKDTVEEKDKFDIIKKSIENQLNLLKDMYTESNDANEKYNNLKNAIKQLAEN